MKHLTLFLILFSQFSFALDESELLDVDQAFKPRVVDVSQNQLTLRFEIAEKYYLYKHAFKFPNDDKTLQFSEALIPEGKKKVDEFFGEVETYREKVEIIVPFENKNNVNSSDFTFKYQGCADAGICYPPQKRTIQVHLPVKEDATNLNQGLPGSGIDDLLGNNNWAGQMDSVLTVDQAFKVETIAMEQDVLSTRFTIHPNIYLYKDKLEIESLTDGVEVKKISYPQGQIKDDPHFGEVEVYFDLAEFEVLIERQNKEVLQLELKVDFQGCVDEGICYPPASQTLWVDLPKINPTSQVSAPAISEQDQIQSDLQQKSWWVTVLRFFGFGLLLALTPCVFPMIPILSGLIVGQGEITRSRAFMLSLIYVLAMALAYTAAGVIAGMLGANIQAAFQKPWIIMLFSGVFVALAISMFGYYELQLPASWQNKLSNISNKQKGGTWIGVAIMGFLSAIIVGPCVAPPLAGAVLYISETGDPVVGGLALFAMSIGMGVPLLLIGASAGQWMPKSGGWMNVVKAFFGIALLGMAVWFLSRIIPPTVTLSLYGVLAVLSSILWYRYAMRNGVAGIGKLILSALCLFLLVAGGLQLYGAVKGHTDPMRPWKKYDHYEFVKIKSLAELKQKMQDSDRPVLLDFYADWCVECIRMEKTTYINKQVQAELDRFLVLKADVTEQNDLDKELMKAFKIIGPPATLFFNSDDKMLNEYNFFGYMDADKFKAHLQRIR